MDAAQNIESGIILNEDKYCETMFHLWNIAIIAMQRLGVTHAIFFPFGMGSFLRHLGQNDSQYLRPLNMRRIRRRIADEFIKAIECAYGRLIEERMTEHGDTKDLPRNIHLCLSCDTEDDILNHNSFIEAAAEKNEEYPGIQDLLVFRRNVDPLQLAHDLAVEMGPLRVGLLNGANRKLLGGQWFKGGSRNAHDENLHRRSSSLARAALLLNLGTVPTMRQENELANTLEWLGGKAEPLRGTNAPPRIYKPSASAMSLTLGYGSQGQQSGDGASPSKPGGSNTNVGGYSSGAPYGSSSASGSQPNPNIVYVQPATGFCCCKRRHDPFKEAAERQKKEEEAQKKTQADAKAKLAAEAEARAKRKAEEAAKTDQASAAV